MAKPDCSKKFPSVSYILADDSVVIIDGAVDTKVLLSELNPDHPIVQKLSSQDAIRLGWWIGFYAGQDFAKGVHP